MPKRDTSPTYRATRNFVLRMPLRHRDEFTALDTYQSVLEALPTMLREPRFKIALQISSPSLLEQLWRLFERPIDSSDPRTRRVLRSLRKYLIRMTRRPTPFGLLSGVAIGRFGNMSTLKPSNTPAGVVEVFPDYAWLMSVISGITEQDAEGCLPIALNPYIHQLGERLDIAHANAFGLGQSVHIDLRVTSATDVVVELAKAGSSRRELIEKLVISHDGVDRDIVTAFVDDLIRNGVIAEKLQPRLESGQELSSILATLNELPSLEDHGRALADLDRLCKSIGTFSDLHSQWESICQAQDTISGKTGTTDRLSINSALSLKADTLHINIARRVEQLANLLVSTDFYPHRPPHLVDFEHHFLERYGVEGEVPILELLSAGRGLEAPDTYRVPARTYSLASYSHKAGEQQSTALIDAYAHALQSGSHLELSDELLVRHATSDFRPPNPTLEYFVRVLSPSRECIDKDDFDLFVIPDGLAQGGRSIGRFARLLGQEATSLVTELFGQEEAQSGEESLLVQLRYMPDKARMANVARTTALDLRVLSLGTAEESTLDLNDVLVGNDGRRFYLRDASSGRRLRIVENHMVSTLNAPNVVRLMLDLSNDWHRSFNMFDWGVLRDASFLPRVTRERIILSPAQWNVKPDTLNKLDTCTPSNRAAQLQASLSLPDEVIFVQGDNRLPLDLRTEIDRDILNDEIARAQKLGMPLCFEEVIGCQKPDPPLALQVSASESHAASWLKDDDGHSYDHELVVPVVWTDAEDNKRQSESALFPRKTTTVRTSHEWDARWVCLDIFGGLDNLDAVVGLDLTDLRKSTQSLASIWFFIRYSIPAHRVRIRLRADSKDNVTIVRTALLAWAQQLLERALIYDYSLVSFVPEINRFGGDEVYDQALSVFASSSELARFVSQVRTKGMNAGIPEDIFGVFVLASCRNSMTLAPSDFAPSPSKEKEFREYYRSNRKNLMEILSCNRLKGLDECIQAELLDLSSAVAATMSSYSDALVHQCMDPARYRSIFASMIHMIFNRTFPTGNAIEQRALDLWALANDAYERRLRALSKDEK